MMNVRVRRCRTKKIGVATGPEQITYPSKKTKATATNKAGASPRAKRNKRNDQEAVASNQSITAADLLEAATAQSNGHHPTNSNDSDRNDDLLPDLSQPQQCSGNNDDDHNANGDEQPAIFAGKTEFTDDQPSCGFDHQSSGYRSPIGVTATPWHTEVSHFSTETYL